MKKLFSLPIRLQLFVIVFIMTLFAFGIIVYSGINFRNEKINESLKDAAILADIVAGENVKMVADMQQLMTALVQLPEVRTLNVEKMQAVLRNVLSVNPKYSNIFIADRTGRVVASAVSGNLLDVSDRRDFRNAVSSGHFSSGEYIISRFTGKPVISFSYPFKDRRGDVIGVIIMGIDLTYYKALLDALQLPSGSSYLLLDHRGIIMNRGIRPTDFVGQQYNPALFKRMADGPERDTFVAVAHDGIKRFISYRKLRLEGETIPYMYVRAGIPVDSALSQANRMLARNLGLLTASLCLVVFLVLFIGKRSILDRIALLERASRRLAGGDLQVKVSDLIKGGELGLLGLTFDHMTAEIRDREAELRQSELRYRTLFDQSPDGVVIVAPDGKIVEFNDAACRQLGYSREEFSRLGISDIDRDERHAEIRYRIETMLNKGRAEFDVRHRTKSGEIRYTHVITKIVALSGEAFLYAIWKDVTEHTRALEMLQLTRFSVDSAVDAVYWMDSTSRIVDVNETACSMLGYTREELLNLTVLDIDPDFTADKWANAWEAVKGRGKLTIETRHRAKDGRIIPVEIVANYLSFGDRELDCAFARDITGRRKADEALRESEKRYRAMFDQSPDGIVLVDTDGKIIEFNESAHRELGYARQEFAQLGVSDLNPFEGPGEVRNRIRRIMQDGKADFYVRHKTKRGELRDVHVIAQIIMLSGRPVTHAIWHDITEIKNMRDRLEEKTAEQNAILENALVGIAFLKDRRFIWINSKMEQMFGWQRNEVNGLTTEIFYTSHESYEQFGKDAYPLLANGETYSSERLMRRKDGSEFWCSLSGKAIDSSALSKGSIWILRDITDYKKAEERLLSALREKETLLRELYHRTKNNMQVITSLIHLQIASASNRQVVNLLNDTQNRIMSMALVHEKLYKSRDLSNVNLKGYIEDLAGAILRSYQADGNKIVRIIQIDDIELSIDTIMPIGLIINELMTNTLKYAFPGDRKGVIRISALITENDEIEIRYADNGIGFPAGLDITRTDSLGLKLVYNLVKGQLRGHLTLNTGEGSEFVIGFREPARKKRI